MSPESIWMSVIIAMSTLAPLVFAQAPGSNVDVLTRAYDIGRTGANGKETQINPANVAGLRKLFSLNVMADLAHPDDPRLEAQPLIVTHITMNDGQAHDVVYVCTMSNNIWAFDANTGSKLWSAPISLGIPVHPPVLKQGEDGFDPKNWPTRTDIDLWGINIHWGILSTPVIDRQSKTLYAVNWTSPDGSVDRSHFQLHAIDLKDGKEKANSPSEIFATFPSPGGGTAEFLPNGQKQRSALLLLPAPISKKAAPMMPRVSGDMGGMDGSDATAPKTAAVIMACGPLKEQDPGKHGWVLAFDPVTLKVTAAFCTTPNGDGGGIWQSGQGPSCDSAANIFAMTANGKFDGTANFSESFLELHYTEPAGPGTAGSFHLSSWFTPFSDDDRAPGFNDQDLGSGGPILPSDMGMALGAGKDGVLYVLEKGKFGNTSLPDLANHAQYQSLKFPPIFFTYFPGFQADPTRLTDLDQNFGGRTHHLHNSPVFWDSPSLGPMLFCWGENEHLRAWTLDRTGKVNFLALGHETASAGPAGGMPGGMLTLSANGRTPNTGIIWATVPILGDGNKFVVEGICRAYDASQFDVNPDGSKNLKLLWDSKRIDGNSFDYDKFCSPVVANGKLYVTTYDGRVDVYGL